MVGSWTDYTAENVFVVDMKLDEIRKDCVVGSEHLLRGWQLENCSFPGGSHRKEDSRVGQLFLEVRLVLSHCFA